MNLMKQPVQSDGCLSAGLPEKDVSFQDFQPVYPVFWIADILYWTYNSLKQSLVPVLFMLLNWTLFWIHAILCHWVWYFCILPKNLARVKRKCASGALSLPGSSTKKSLLMLHRFHWCLQRSDSELLGYLESFRSRESIFYAVLTKIYQPTVDGRNPAPPGMG